MYIVKPKKIYKIMENWEMVRTEHNCVDVLLVSDIWMWVNVCHWFICWCYGAWNLYFVFYGNRMLFLFIVLCTLLMVSHNKYYIISVKLNTATVSMAYFWRIRGLFTHFLIYVHLLYTYQLFQHLTVGSCFWLG